jgi:hypothetical protein
MFYHRMKIWALAGALSLFASNGMSAVVNIDYDVQVTQDPGKTLDITFLLKNSDFTFNGIDFTLMWDPNDLEPKADDADFLIFGELMDGFGVLGSPNRLPNGDGVILSDIDFNLFDHSGPGKLFTLSFNIKPNLLLPKQTQFFFPDVNSFSLSGVNLPADTSTKTVSSFSRELEAPEVTTVVPLPPSSILFLFAAGLLATGFRGKKQGSVSSL